MATFLLEGRVVRGRCQNVIKCDDFHILFLFVKRTEVCCNDKIYFDPERMFNQQRFLNVWALAAVQFDICE